MIYFTLWCKIPSFEQMICFTLLLFGKLCEALIRWFISHFDARFQALSRWFWRCNIPICCCASVCLRTSKLSKKRVHFVGDIFWYDRFMLHKHLSNISDALKIEPLAWITICTIPEEHLCNREPTKWSKPAEYQKFGNKLI
jgi:hypothetical protein